MNNVYVIIPSYNEGGKIKETLQSLLAYNFNLVVIDDGSDDQTHEALKGLPIHYIRHLVNLGQGASIETGIRFAMKLGAEKYVTFDADGQHNPDNLLPMINFLENRKLDVLFGSRFMKGSSTNIKWNRRMILKTAIILNYLLSGVLLTDAHNGLRVCNTIGAEAFLNISNKMAHASDILVNSKRLKLQIGEFPVEITYSKYSNNKGQSGLNSLNILKDIIIKKIFSV